jgi:hypothetical protein
MRLLLHGPFSSKQALPILPTLSRIFPLGLAILVPRRATDQVNLEEMFETPCQTEV